METPPLLNNPVIDAFFNKTRFIDNFGIFPNTNIYFITKNTIKKKTDQL